MSGCSVCESMRKFLPDPLAERLRKIENDRALRRAMKNADREFKRRARQPTQLPGETTNRVLPRGNR